MQARNVTTPCGHILAHPNLVGVCRAFVNNGQVKISDDAFEKGRAHPLGAALDFRFVDDDNALRMAALLGIAAGLDKQTLRAIA